MRQARDTSDDHEPLWHVGQFVGLTVEELRAQCVEAFPESATRVGLFADFQVVLDRLRELGVTGEIWLDGSFVTKKQDPRDIDLVVFPEEDQYDNGSDELRAALDGLTTPLGGWPPATCDTNVRYFGEDARRYWEERFGTMPTKGLPKGIVTVRLEQPVVAEDQEIEADQPDPEAPQ